jgi:hypothetical protein
MIRLSIPLRQLATTLLAITLLVACAPGEPIPSAEEIQAAINTSVAGTMEAQGQIATSVALTVAARETEAAAALPSPTLSPTPLPTLTPILPAATPFTLTPASRGGGGGGGGGGGTSGAGAEYACDIIRQRPRDNTEFLRTHTFDVSFAILNTGTKTWVAGKDLVLLGNPGPTLIAPPGLIQLPEMEPGDVFTVGPFDAVAPDVAGHYVIDFKLEGGFCYPYVAFNVVR